MRRIILESPYSGDLDRNLRYARRAARDALLRGESPLLSHLLYTQPGILDDNTPAERNLGINAGHAWTPSADAIVAYVDYGVSDGMQRGIDVAHKYKIPVEYRRIGVNEP